MNIESVKRRLEALEQTAGTGATETEDLEAAKARARRELDADGLDAVMARFRQADPYDQADLTRPAVILVLCERVRAATEGMTPEEYDACCKRAVESFRPEMQAKGVPGW